VKYPG